MRHPGSIRPHGHGWEVRLCVAGVRRSFTLHTEDKREAQAWAKQKEAELQRQAERYGANRPTPVPMSELLAQFERDELPGKAVGTQGAYADSLKPIRHYFVRELRDPCVDRVTSAHVRAFITWRRAHRIRCRLLPDGTAALDVVPGATHGRTVSKDRAVLHQLFGLAEDFEYREGNPVTRRTTVGRISTREPVILTEAQYEALLVAASADPMLQLYLLAVGETAARNESEGKLLDEYVACFNRRDWDALRRLIRSDARVELVGVTELDVLGVDAPYFHNYSALPWEWKLSRARVDGEPLIVHWRKVGADWVPLAAIRLWWRDGKVARIRDYVHVDYLLAHARTEVGD